MHHNADQMSEEADRAREVDRAQAEGVELLVTAFPSSGDFHGSLCPGFFEVFSEPERNNTAVPLAFGAYDVHLQRVWQGDERETYQCVRFAVEIDGDVVVAAPEMGECP
jgi:hypothetical protein